MSDAKLPGPGKKKARTTRTQKKAAAKKAPKKKKKKRPDWTKRWLEAFATHGTVSAACEAAGVARSTVYDRRQSDEKFALAWSDVELKVTEAMEQEARRRGQLGVEEPVFYKGEVAGHVRKFSDVLLMFMLKGRKPETYRETVQHHHSGKVRTDPPEVPSDKERIDEVSQILVSTGAVASGTPPA